VTTTWGTGAAAWPESAQKHRLVRAGAQKIFSGQLLTYKMQFTSQSTHAVVCLRGGERDTCLGLPLFWGPPWRITRLHFPYFGWKTYHALHYCTKQII